MSGKAVNHRVWMPLAIGGLALVGIVILLLQRDLDHNFKCWYMSVTVLLAVLLEFVWFLLLSRFDWRLRLATFCVIALAIFGLTKMAHVTGTATGTGLPRLVPFAALTRPPFRFPSAFPVFAPPSLAPGSSQL